MLGKTDWWITIIDNSTNKQFTKYFESEYKLDKFKYSLKFKPRYTILECSTDKYFSD